MEFLNYLEFFMPVHMEYQHISLNKVKQNKKKCLLYNFGIINSSNICILNLTNAYLRKYSID